MNGRDRLTLSMALYNDSNSTSLLKFKMVALFPYFRSTGRGRVAGVDRTGGGVRYGRCLAKPEDWQRPSRARDDFKFTISNSPCERKFEIITRP